MNWAEITYQTATIANGQTTSDEQDLSSGRSIVGVITPGTLTSTTLTFSAATVSGGTYTPVYDEGSQYSITVGTSRYVALKISVFAGVRYLKIVGGSSEGGTRTITLVMRNV